MENSRKWTVYMHRHKDSGKVYISTTSQSLNSRFRHDGIGYKTGYGTDTRFWKAIKEYGWDSFEHITIETGLDEKTAKSMEEKLIAEHKSNNPEYGFNSTLGGNGAKGIVCSAETRLRRSEYMKNRIVSAETRKKQSEAKKGIVPWNKGKHPGFTQKQKEASMKRCRKVRTSDGVFDSVKACAEYYNIYTCVLNKILHGVVVSKKYDHINAEYV